MPTIYEQLELHEGFRSKPYKDKYGNVTIGYGRNLDAKGISKEEGRYLLRNDINETAKSLERYNWYNKLSPIRQKVLIDMGVNLGVPGLLKFKRMIQAIKNEDFRKAAVEMKNSKWYNQVGIRAKRLEKMMRTGEDYE